MKTYLLYLMMIHILSSSISVESTRNQDTGDDKEISEKRFWCIFKCLGRISAVGIGGILALIGLATYGLPVIGFGAAGIVAGFLAAVGIGWKAILGAFSFSAVMTAVEKTCSHCMDQ